MKLSLFNFDKNGLQEITEEIDFSDISYPLSQLKSFDKVLVHISAKKYDDFIAVHFEVRAKLTAISSYTNNEGTLNLNLTDDLNFALFNNEDYEDFETFKGNAINIDDYVYSLIIASFPSKVVFKGEKLPSNTIDSTFMSEEEYLASKQKKHSSPFDVLDEKDD